MEADKITLTPEQIQANKEEYLSVLKQVNRIGIQKLAEWLDKETDFFTAPASTRYHGSSAGMLCRHSLNVYERLCLLLSMEESLKTKEEKLGPEESQKMLESAALVALCHDLCKVNVYTQKAHNKKVYSDKGSKWDELGKFDWVSELQYDFNDPHKFGHGAASLEILTMFLGVDGLTREERSAIYYHMGEYTEDRQTGEVYNEYPLAILLHVADELATFVCEREPSGATEAFWATLRQYARSR